MKRSKYKGQYKILLDQLYRLRISSGLKQSELSEQLGVSQSFISKIENGERKIDIIELKTICNILGTTLELFIKEFENKLNESR